MTTRFLEATDRPVSGAYAILGVPYDDTACYHKGACKGPEAIRLASDNLEDYCPVADRRIQEVGLCDLGDVAAYPGIGDAVHALTRSACEDILHTGARPLILGGEHSVSIPVIHLLAERHPDLCVIQFDAHADLRDGYEGEANSHASIMRRALDRLPSSQIFQIGIRSGTQEEWAFMREHGTLILPSPEAVATLRGIIGPRPVYLTIDLDVLDPSIFPGTGTPEPPGLSFGEFDACLRALIGLNIVGADVVELAPELDPSGVSSVVAAKVVRTIALSL